MKKHILSILILFTIVAFFACKNEKKQKVIDTVSSVKTSTDTTVNNPKLISQSDENIHGPIFSATAKTVKDFIPQHYDIDMETEGDLNADGLKDQVLVLINTNDTTALRISVVLLKQKDNSYKFYAKSFGMVEPKYREDGFLNYDYEDIGIDKNGALTVTQQATGPNGSLESTFEFINNELVLTNISSFTMGAGGQTELKLDLLKSIFEETDINTMKEDMPSETTTKKYKLAKVLFADGDPREIIIKAFDKLGN